MSEDFNPYTPHQQAADATASLALFICEVCGSAALTDATQIKKRFEDFLAAYPWRGATKRGVAAHEAGHLVAFEIEGLSPDSARIRSPIEVGGAWGGTAKFKGSVRRERHLCTGNAEDFLRLARATLAGPVAEDLLGDGNIACNVLELVEARILSDRAADLGNLSSRPTWDEAICSAVACVERSREEIKQIAGRLARSPYKVEASSPCIATILRRAARRKPENALSVRGKLLAEKIIQLLDDLAGAKV